MTTPAEKLRQIVADARGDDLERCQAAFKRCTLYEMNTQYGKSRKTRREILEEYEADRREWHAVAELTERLLVADAKATAKGE